MSVSSPAKGVSGLLVVDKPQGVTSHDVVAAVRAVLHTTKVGHAGTLDPMATGVLVIGFGHATRLLNAIVEHDKTYEATIRLGLSTTTDDAEGDIIPDAVVPCDLDVVRRSVGDVIESRFTGAIEQVPSSYSAIKVDGKRAYDLARAGKPVRLQARMVTVSRFEVLGMRSVKVNTTVGGRECLDVDVVVTCSVGTYIRALARDLGVALGTGGYLTRLRRSRVGAFSQTMPQLVHVGTEPRRYVSREGIETTRTKAVFPMDADGLLGYAISMFDAVRMTMPTIGIDDGQAADLRHGRRIMMRITGTTAAYRKRDGDVVALLESVDDHEARPVVVFPADEPTATVDAAPRK